MFINIDKKSYQINSNEFNVQHDIKMEPMVIHDELGQMERICSLLRELACLDIQSIIFYNSTHGGFIPINVSDKYENVYVQNTSPEHIDNIHRNVTDHNITNVKWEIENTIGNFVVYSEKYEYLDVEFIAKHNPIIVTANCVSMQSIYKTSLQLTDSKFIVCIPEEVRSSFYDNFNYYIQQNEQNEQNEEVLSYDNLINLCIMVKNGGEQFEKMLQQNMHLIDRWTILDTGSTDNTIDIIKKTLIGKKKGELYEEPFINFRDSRNRLLELAGETCKYTLMLDDTYVVQGDIRKFLKLVRGDQFADSFSIYIRSYDIEYVSNRILKTDRKLKYIYKIHEVIQDENNANICVPRNSSHIIDYTYEYMEDRSNVRKQYDITMLLEDLQEYPNNPRTYYYLGQTYKLIKDYENAFKYYMERANHPSEGFLQEKIDAIFESARCAHFFLNKPWQECEVLYKRAYELDKTRPDSIYFIGIHYYIDGDKTTAYKYFKTAFEIGYPVHGQYCLKPTLSYISLPTLLTPLCYEFNDFVLGEKCTKLFLDKNNSDIDGYSVISSWYEIFVKLNQMDNILTVKLQYDLNKPLLCFVADGGFEPWTGSDILTKGVGGSETYIIEMSRHIQKRGEYKVVVFCNCLEQSIFENVEYIPITQFMPFAKHTNIHTCIISRFSEYIPVAIHGNVENIYMVVHDLLPSGLVIPITDKLKRIFCLSEWHKEHFIQTFPQLVHITDIFYNGIYVELFDNESVVDDIDQTNPRDQRDGSVNNDNRHIMKPNIQISMVESVPKIPYKFIYSSYPDRGLYELLQMWPDIVAKYPESNLHIYSDIDGKWVNNVKPEVMKKIRDLYAQYDKYPNGMNIYKYGWVNKKVLAEAWKSAEYWLYPCTFIETFCITALEAAVSKTLAITNGLGALQNTVADRGICIEGCASSIEWREKALQELFSIMENVDHRRELVEKNYKWAKNLSWESRAEKLLIDYINDHPLEYAGMYNWTNDIPIGTNAKQRFENAIQYYMNNSAKETSHWVLEIGVYTGTSLIEIIRKIPNSFGVAIDSWKNYNEENGDMLKNIEKNNIEQIFYRNIKIAGVEDRIRSIKGCSADILLELIGLNMQYDFIYIDGSHTCLDVFLDLFLSWKLLRKGGVMAIDDYLFHVNKVKEYPYNYPYEAVNTFLKQREGEYILIDMDYRVFLEKIK